MIIFTKHAGVKSAIWTSFARKFFTIAAIVVIQFQVANAQSLSFTFKNAPFQSVITEVSKKTGYEFVYDAAYLQQAVNVNLSLKNSTIQEVLQAVFKNQPFQYEIAGKAIVIKPMVSRKSEGGYLVRGIIKDSTGVTIPGASVRIKGKNTATQTDATGNFEINMNAQAPVLVISYMGYKDKEVETRSSAGTGVSTFVLSANANLLEDVVVTGYQTISRERSTASITQIGNEQLNKQINGDLLQALEGQVPGMVYTKNPTGGGADKPVIRGASTFSVSIGTDPLIVIDGLPTEMTLDQINPYDIESITVLKDAAAASIYGSRAANGVIVLTTKQGKGGGVKISLNADLFVTSKPDVSKMHYASTSDLIDYETAQYNYEKVKYGSTAALFAYYGDVNNGTVHYYSPLYQLYRSQEAGTISAAQVNTTLNQWRNNDYLADYKKNVWQEEVRKRYNMSLSSSSAKNNTYMSLNYDESNERVKYNKDQNFNLYFKSTYNLKKWLTASFGFNGTYSADHATDAAYSDYNIQPRYAQITDANGNRVMADYVNIPGSAGEVNGAVAAKLKTLSDFKSVGFNVLDELQNGMTTTKNMSVRSFANIKVDLFKGLSYNAQFQYENARIDQDTYNESSSYVMRNIYNAYTTYNATTAKYAHAVPDGGRYRQLSTQKWNYTLRQQLSFDRFFGNKGNEHSIAAIAGFEMRQTMTPRSIEQLRYGYDPQTLTSVNLDDYSLSQTGISSYIYGTTKTLGALSTQQNEIKHRYVSMYSNLSYTFRSKYSLTGSVRVDQADLFGSDPKYRYRPLWSAGAGWNASNEDFLKNIDWLSLLKVRATYGINGNVDQTSSPYLVAKRKADVLYPTLYYTDIATLPNPKLRWEQTATKNFGIDYAFFNNRLRGSIDAYEKRSTDLLVTTSLDPTVGTSSISLNNGALRNKGLEMAVGGDWLKANDLTLSSNFVLSFNKNTVDKVTSATTTAYSYVGAPTNNFFINTPLNSLYAYQYGGMVNGYPYFLDENGKSNVVFNAAGTPTSIKDITSPLALKNMGTLTPTYSGSFTQRIRYKEFELGAMLVFSGGNKLRKDVTSLSTLSVNDEDIVNRWTPTNTTTDLPRLLVDYPTALATSAGTLSTLWQYSDKQVLSADYIKLRNVSFSYNLPKGLSNLLKVSSAKITAQANNLWYWSKAGDDIDPETYSLNSGTRSLQIPTSFLLGINVNF